ncbi:MAG: hypothetical protein ACRDYV_17935, partial [Acidimicrobiia bacterium]
AGTGQVAAPAQPEVPAWDNRPDSAPGPLQPAATPTASPADPSSPQEVAIAVPEQVKEARRRLTASNARNSLSAMAMTIILGMGWNIFSVCRRRYGWF